MDHCSFQALAPTAAAGGQVQTAPLSAGTAEAIIDISVGAALGAYTARAGFLGSSKKVDLRKAATSGTFNPSVGIETFPRARALALRAGAETIVMIKLDIATSYEGLVFDVEDRLGPDFAGKVIIAASHTHSGWGHFSGHSGYQMGMGQFRTKIHNQLVNTSEAVARAALATLQPVRLGIHDDLGFDPEDLITQDRRPENDALMGGARKDDALHVIRIDTAAGTPLAVIPIFGIHPTLSGADNSMASTDAIGGIERVLEETLGTAANPVMVMHLQGAAGDVSPVSHGKHLCNPNNDEDERDKPCFRWYRAEALGRKALPTLLDAWTQAGESMTTELAIEMITRSIELGPRAETFAIREGALRYEDFDDERSVDGIIWNQDGSIATPIDEFNAPVGAALCDSDTTDYFGALIPGTGDLSPYGSCARTDQMTPVFESLLLVDLESDVDRPVCQSTRTTISALRLGDHVITTLPGEPTVAIADYIRAHSPLPGANTIVLGFAQGHIGYLLQPEDWLQGGFESSINLWGPLEGEYVAEQALALLPLALSDEREDGTAGGTDRVVVPQTLDNDIVSDNPAPQAGTIPTELPENLWMRGGAPAFAQPDDAIQRVSGVARFVWIGDDPTVHTPRIVLERKNDLGEYEAVQRGSGRALEDGEVLLEYTPIPLRREGNQPQTHYWAAEFQATPWLGQRDQSGAPIDALKDFGSLPLGDYRFHVFGSDWELTSQDFEVIPATLLLRADTLLDTTLRIRVRIHAIDGYRLLDFAHPLNGAFPLVDQTFKVTLELDDGNIVVYDDVVTDDTGRIYLPVGNAVLATVEDRFGNLGKTRVW